MQKLTTLLLASSFLSIANAATLDLLKITQKALSLSQESISGHQECYAKAQRQYAELYHAPIHQIDLSRYSKSQLELALKQSFQTRLNIRERLKDYKASAPYADKCLSAVRSATRALRYLEDYLVEHMEDTTSDKYETLTGKGSYFIINDPSFQSYHDLQSGDIILSRGGAYTSAAIARIGVDEAQFSHMSFVYKDEKGQLHTTEAHIELGSVVAPIQTHIDQKNIRTVVFRYHDQNLAHLAAKYMYEKVKDHSARFTENIYYDFGMNYKDNSSLFCSEVVYDGFNAITQGRVSVPLYRTKFPAKLVPFLNQIGIQVNSETVKNFETFAPADIEFDPRFKLIAEWRRPNKLHDSKVKDAILSSMLKWIEHGYIFKPTRGMKFKSFVAWLGRRLPWVKESLREKLPRNMNRRQLKVFLVLDEVGEAIQKKVEEQEKLMGREMSFKEMFHYLETLRSKDEKNLLLARKIRRQLRSTPIGRQRAHLRSKIPWLVFHHLFNRH